MSAEEEIVRLGPGRDPQQAIARPVEDALGIHAQILCGLIRGEESSEFSGHALPAVTIEIEQKGGLDWAIRQALLEASFRSDCCQLSRFVAM